MKRYISNIVVCAVAALLLSSCSEDFLETSPSDAISSDQVFTTTTNGMAALNGIHRTLYKQYRYSDECGESGMKIKLDMLGEDIVMTSAGNGWFNTTYKWTAHRDENNRCVEFAYRFYYELIANANMIINNIDKAQGSDEEKQNIKAEALTYRAWCHLVLVQLYGERYDAASKPNDQMGVPIMITNTTAGLTRESVEKVYEQILDDLTEAENNFTTSGTERSSVSHFNLNVVYGLRARVALTMQNWTDAVAYAKKAREDFTLMSNDEVLEGFNSVDNPEWIWGSEVTTEQTTYFHSFFAFMSVNFSSTNIRTNPKAINSSLYDMISDTDIRKQLWDPNAPDNADWPASDRHKRYPYINKKFFAEAASSSLGDVVYMRTAEMVLIEAEAYARDGQDGNAQDALYELANNRDASYVKSTKVGQELIDEIMVQRRVELWGEGFRFLDLKRTNSALDRTNANHNESLCETFEVPAGDKRWQFLIPQDELNANPAIKDQQNPL